ncbi:MAG TPA: GTP cyclohydrolase II [Chloroflexota bacterium]|nr:GTP cyclohydrolase II [Chloroflexota bacterium]
MPDRIVAETVPTAVRVAEADLPTTHGMFRIAAFRVDGAQTEVVALLRGNDRHAVPLVRLHSECFTGDALGSLRCDCGEQLDAALAQIARARRGILLYLHQEGRGIGLVNKIRAYALQDQGYDTVDANIALGLPVDGRDYGAAAAVLRFLGVRQVRLLTNNPDKCRALERHGIKVRRRVPLQIPPNPANDAYLRTKARRMGHILSWAAREDNAEVS